MEEVVFGMRLGRWCFRQTGNRRSLQLGLEEDVMKGLLYVDKTNR